MINEISNPKPFFSKVSLQVGNHPQWPFDSISGPWSSVGKSMFFIAGNGKYTEEGLSPCVNMELSKVMGVRYPQSSILFSDFPV
jgi:hypothetical protein